MMKYILFFGFLLINTFSVLATSVPLSEIEDSLTSFLAKDSYRARFDLKIENCVVLDIRTKEKLVQKSEGIFKFKILVSGELFYLLLVDENSFEIVDTEKPLNDIIMDVFDFISKGNWSNREILDCLQEILEVLNQNEQIKDAHWQSP